MIINFVLIKVMKFYESKILSTVSGTIVFGECVTPNDR